MEEEKAANRHTNRTLPPNYVSILDLKNRWLKQQQEKAEVQQQEEEQRQESHLPPSTEAVADPNPNPTNRRPFQRRNSRVEDQPPPESRDEVSREIASPDPQIGGPEVKKAENRTPFRRRNGFRVKKESPEVGDEVSGEKEGPEPEIGEQEGKKKPNRWKKKKKRMKRKQETVKLVVEKQDDDLAAAMEEIGCGLAMVSVGGNEGTERSCDEVRDESHSTNAVKERCGGGTEEGNVVKERRGWRDGRGWEKSRRPEWRNDGGYSRFDRPMVSRRGRSDLVWVRKVDASEESNAMV